MMARIRTRPSKFEEECIIRAANAVAGISRLAGTGRAKAAVEPLAQAAAADMASRILKWSAISKLELVANSTRNIDAVEAVAQAMASMFNAGVRDADIALRYMLSLSKRPDGGDTLILFAQSAKLHPEMASSLSNISGLSGGPASLSLGLRVAESGRFSAMVQRLAHKPDQDDEVRQIWIAIVGIGASTRSEHAASAALAALEKQAEAGASAVKVKDAAWEIYNTASETGDVEKTIRKAKAFRPSSTEGIRPLLRKSGSRI